MKKISLILILVILALPMIFADAYTDFSRPYVQDKCYSGGTGDCMTSESYLLRSAFDTGINYSSDNWGYCSIAGGGSEFKGVPLSYYDYSSSYEHHSFLVLYESSLSQVNSDCDIIDTVVFSGKAVSQLGVINVGYSETAIVLPYIAFAYNKTIDSKIYVVIMTLNEETSQLEFINEIEIGTAAEWGGYESLMGIAGGVLDNDFNNQNQEDFYFGLYSKKNDKFAMITDIDDDGFIDDKETIVNVTKYTDITTNNHIFFDDWDADGTNEYLIPINHAATDQTFRFELISITPTINAPYYVKTSYTHNISISDTGGDKVLGVGDGYFSICQIGQETSSLEGCFYVRKIDIDSDYNVMTGFINTDYNSDFNAQYSADTTAGKFINPPFTLYRNGEYLFCGQKGDFTPVEYTCVDEDETEIFDFILNNSISTTNPLEIFVTDIDGNTNTYEFLLSSGDVDGIVMNGTNTKLTSWQSTFDGSFTGRLYVQDISGDETSELIYLDETYLRIYSMNNTPFTFLDATSYISLTTTTSSTTTTIKNYDPNVPVIYTQINNNIEYIFALFLILGLAIFSAIMTKSTIIGIIGAFVGTVLSVMLGLISTGLLVIILVFMVLIAVVGFFYKGGN